MHSSLRIAFLVFPFCCFSQNLVRNPSFEEKQYCTFFIGNLNAAVTHWNTPNVATTDFFNSCSDGDAGVPANFIGVQRPKTGQNYAGFYLYSANNYREYAQGSLSKTLEKGKQYRISFYLSLADKVRWSLKKIGVAFTANKLKLITDKQITEKMIDKKNPDNSYQILSISSERFFDDTKKWMRLETVFTANGSENYFSIGSFEGNWSQERREVPGSGKLDAAYYYIDDVSVTLLEEPDPEIQQQPAIEKAKTSVLQHVNFGFDKIEITEKAKEELHAIFQVLDTEKQTSLFLSGHTDNIGSKEYNFSISRKRAQAVADYLIAAGIQASRITISGQADEEPIATNDTEEGRHKNRRVEFRIE